MKLRKLHIGFIVAVFISVFTGIIYAQTNSIPENYFSEFQQNVNELAGINCFSDSEFYRGKFKFSTVNNFSEEYKSLNFGLFPDVLQKSAEYFQYFNSLSDENKKNLVRLFSFYEKDFDRILKKEKLSAELKYLAPALSAMNSKAVSSDQKTGVWQLTHFQSVLNGGEVNQLVDERLNVYCSTQIAAHQIKQNVTIFGNTELAVIAFICGNTKVKNAVFEAGEKATFLEILNVLPKEVSDNIAAFQAIAVFLNTNLFESSKEPITAEIHPDTVWVHSQIHFQQIENVIQVPENQLAFFNPQYKFSIIPGAEKPERLVLPFGKKDDFILWTDSIIHFGDSTLFQVMAQKIEYPPAPNRQYLGEPVKDLKIEGKTKIQYRLKTGDVLGIIAEKYDVHVADLKYWNNIYNERKIQAGQKIDIFVSDDQADYYLNLEKQTTGNIPTQNDVVQQIQKNTTLKVYEEFDTNKKIEHVVKSGESPFIIAKQYKGVTPELILEWNEIDNPRKIQIGQKLIIYPQK